MEPLGMPRGAPDFHRTQFEDQGSSACFPARPHTCDEYFTRATKIITHILKKNMQTTGNHQMARIVRHNDESVREGYIRNGGKAVKLFTSPLKAFQCNNHILMAQKKHLNDFLRGRNIGRLECGRTQLEVSEELEIAQSVIAMLWQRFQDDGVAAVAEWYRYRTVACFVTGLPRVTTPNEDRYLEVTAKRNRRSTASNLSRQLSSATGTAVSRQIVYRRLGHIGLHARRPVRCVPLTATHCRLRLTWSRVHALWTPQQWSCVMFSSLRRVQEDITRMDWPVYSPDMNPIEHVWDMLGRQIAARQLPPTCLPEFRRTLLDEWCNIPQDQMDNLILSMPRRCKACIASSGRHTPD
ncbi:transposable element Tcb1 transposase [Trichonephila clavipes]|nr:transposable element Tcb1 transposase [Trichonephila clavipes]